MAYDPTAPLRDRRVPRDAIAEGRAYLIHARNGGIGVAVTDDEGHLGYELRREKGGRVYLFVEWDWDDDPKVGTAIPLRELPDQPPSERAQWLDWLASLEEQHRDEVKANWRVVLGPLADR